MPKGKLTTSFVGGSGPEFEVELTPAKLGWGPDTQAYPDKIVVNPIDGAEMVWVPPGTFSMGALGVEMSDLLLMERPHLPLGVNWLPDDEGPNHSVQITCGFWLYKYPVTLGQWKGLFGGSQPEGYKIFGDDDFGDDHPVVWVSWHDASTYAEKALLVLPTEAQWEYAARGQTYRSFPWGDTADPQRCQFIGSLHSYKHTAPVGSFPSGASWCGALDMAGNVWEWCEDWFAPYSQRPGPGPLADPRCTDNSSGRRVLRGGSYYSHIIAARCSARIRVSPDHALNYFGFRCMAR